MQTSLPYIKCACPSENKTPYKWVIVRLKEVMFQPGLPKQFAVSSEVCFYDCSGFRVNELKFHFSGAPCICQHILQIESRAGLASAHFSHRLFNRQQSSQTLPKRLGVVVVVRAFLCSALQELLKGSEDEVSIYLLVKESSCSAGRNQSCYSAAIMRKELWTISFTNPCKSNFYLSFR